MKKKLRFTFWQNINDDICININVQYFEYLSFISSS